MSPEQRLTIREAVDLIAERGAVPITEAALRARIRSRRVGVVRVGNRVYTNPLNLVTAGLLPVEALDGVQRVPRAEIDDAELHAWLNPPGEDAPAEAEAETPPVPEDAIDAAPQEPEARVAPTAPVTERPTGTDSTVGRGAPGALERALTDDTTASTERERHGDGRSSPNAGTARPTGGATSGGRRHARSSPSGRRWAGPIVVALAVLAAGVILTAGGEGGRGEHVAEARDGSVVRLGDVLDRSLAGAAERAADRGDYDAAAALAAAAGDERAIDRWLEAAARIELARARRAVGHGDLRQARRHLQRARSRYGDPLPERRRAVMASVSRTERTRQRAAARRARDAKQPTPIVVSSPPPSSTSDGGSSAPSTSSASSAGSGTTVGSGGSGSRSSSSASGAGSGSSSGSGSSKGPGEFF